MKTFATEPVIAKMSLKSLKSYRRRILNELQSVKFCDCGCGSLLFDNRGEHGLYNAEEYPMLYKQFRKLEDHKLLVNSYYFPKK